MKELRYTVNDPFGLHARPAGRLAKLAQTFSAKLTACCKGNHCDPKQVMPLMGLGIHQGDELLLQAEGADEAEAIAALGKFLAENV